MSAPHTAPGGNRAKPAYRRHAMSVDVEDWYHDGAGSPSAIFEERVEANVLRLLDMFAAGGTRATFFFLGEVAQRFPGMVRRVAKEGHEIGSHGHSHRPLQAMLRKEFRSDVERSLRVLEDLTGHRVRGYRAPYFSIKIGMRWPIETLAELGLEYDSSILPIDRPPGLELVSPRAPFRYPNGLWEVPVAVLRLFFFWHLPLASGAGLRFLPPRLLRRCLRHFEDDVGSGLFYLHPWEMDAQSPTNPAASRWLLRVGRRRLPERLQGVLEEIAFAPICEVFRQQLQGRP